MVNEIQEPVTNRGYRLMMLRPELRAMTGTREWVPVVPPMSSANLRNLIWSLHNSIQTIKVIQEENPYAVLLVIFSTSSKSIQ